MNHQSDRNVFISVWSELLSFFRRHTASFIVFNSRVSFQNLLRKECYCFYAINICIFKQSCLWFGNTTCIKNKCKCCFGLKAVTHTSADQGLLFTDRDIAGTVGSDFTPLPHIRFTSQIALSLLEWSHFSLVCFWVCLNHACGVWGHWDKWVALMFLCSVSEEYKWCIWVERNCNMYSF